MPRAQRELQMLEVAELVFAERGFHAASMDEIAERVGVSKPMLYEYFGSKDGLLVACITRVRTELLEATRQAVGQASGARDLVWRGNLAFFEFIERHGRAWSVLLHESMVGPAATEIESIRRQQTTFIAGLLARYVTSATQTELEAYAQILVGACERLAVWRDQHPDVTAEDATRALMAMVWPGIAALIGTAP